MSAVADTLRRVPTAFFGDLEVSAADLLRAPEGLLGFPHAREFLLLPAVRDGMYWFQSTTAPALVFLVLEPARFYPGYAMTVDPVLVPGWFRGRAEVTALAIVTLPPLPDGPLTVNLQGLLLVDAARGDLCQIVLPDPRFGTRHQLVLDPAADPIAPAA